MWCYLKVPNDEPVGCGIAMPEPDCMLGAAPVEALFIDGELTLEVAESPGVSTDVC